jgi:hypothetical protein
MNKEEINIVCVNFKKKHEKKKANKNRIKQS